MSPPEPASEHPTLTDGTVTLRPVSDDGVAGRFEIEVGDDVVGELGLQRLDPHTVELSWRLNEAVRKRGYATRALRTLVDWALTDTDDGGFGISRVQARVAADNTDALRLATRGGMSREGTQRVVPGTGDREETTEYVVFSRLATDPPLSDPSSFRSLLNAMLPRKRAIGQMLVRDPDGRVLLCQLTYKRDWDLPGGVVEVGENPKEAVAREVTEELGLTIDAGDLLITDWLPPWGGWDDALCLVFDGGTHAPAILAGMVTQVREIRTAEFCTLEQIDERCTDFTARRIRAALATHGSVFTESGR